MPGNSSNYFAITSPHWVSTLEYGSSFDQAKSQALDVFHQWYPQRQSQELDLSGVEACVVIKNHERAVVHDNPAHRLFFSNDCGNTDIPSACGTERGRPHPQAVRSAGASIDFQSQYRSSRLARNTDELIVEGIRSLDCEHEDYVASGQTYSFRTFKCQIDDLRDPNYFIFSITRPIACLGSPEADRAASLKNQLEIFQSLDAIDQLTCRMDARGESTKDIAAAVRLSPRAIEIRRKKMLELFGVSRPMELVRITILLEEHGLLAGQ